MKSTLERLTAADREALARLYDTEGYRVLKKVHNLELVGLGKDALGATEIDQVKFLAGRAHQSKVTLEMIRTVYKQINKVDE